MGSKNNTVSAIDEQLALLANTTTDLGLVDLGRLNEYIGNQIMQLNSFATECSEVFCDTLTSLITELAASSSSLSSTTSSSRRSIHPTDSTIRFGSLVAPTTR